MILTDSSLEKAITTHSLVFLILKLETAAQDARRLAFYTWEIVV